MIHKALIDTDGLLSLERAGSLLLQMCPHGINRVKGDLFCFCGDWCPLFSEPELKGFECEELHLCNGKVVKVRYVDDLRKRGDRS